MAMEVIGFGGPMVERLQLHTPERRGSIVLTSCTWFSMPKEPLLVFHAILFRLYDNFFEYVAKFFVKGFYQAICTSIVHGRLLLGKLKLFAQASHQAVEEGLTIIGDNVPRHTILIDNVCPYEVDRIFLFDIP